jgi:hypothetical protein
MVFREDSSLKKFAEYSEEEIKQFLDEPNRDCKNYTPQNVWIYKNVGEK